MELLGHGGRGEGDDEGDGEEELLHGGLHSGFGRLIHARSGWPLIPSNKDRWAATPLFFQCPLAMELVRLAQRLANRRKIPAKHSLRIEGEAEDRALGEGDWLLLPAHCRHRVVWTRALPPTVWLAIHCAADG